LPVGEKRSGILTVLFTIISIMPPKAWLGVIFMSGVWIFDKCSSRSSRSTYTSGSSSFSSSYSGSPASSYAPIYGPSAGETAAGLEEKPVVGTGRSFSTNELRYCVFENERLERMKPLVVNNRQVAKFNRFVEDYNSRCGNFRYLPSSMNAVRREAASKSKEFSAEAKRRLK
jgi:hypothetical protein